MSFIVFREDKCPLSGLYVLCPLSGLDKISVLSGLVNKANLAHNFS